MSQIQTEIDAQLVAFRSGPLKGSIRAPGDKSISHRALIFGALATGTTTIEGLLESDDVLATARAVGQLGARLQRSQDGRWQVEGVGKRGFQSPAEPIDFGNSGTAARLMMGAMASQPVRAELKGDRSLSARPMGRVIDPLVQMGAWNGVRPATDKLPLLFEGAQADASKAIEYRLPVPSAQVKSAVLLAGLRIKGRTSVIETEPTRDHTERMLELFGAEIHREPLSGGGTRISIDGPADLSARHVTVPGDPSSAAFATVGALIIDGSDVRIENVLLNESRAGLYRTLIEMGAKIDFENERMQSGEKVADLRVRSSRLKSVVVPGNRAPSMIDEYPALCIAAARAEGTTRMEGLAELRVKESDRLGAMASGLERSGIAARSADDWLEVTGGADCPGGQLIETRHDHRIAMSFLVLGLISSAPIRVDGAGMIATSYPEFVQHMSTLGADIRAMDR